MFHDLMKIWHNYKYRFVPWIAFNLNDRSARSVPKGTSDKIISDDSIYITLITLFEEFQKAETTCNWSQLNQINSRVVNHVLGFQLERKPSKVANGRGVIVTNGLVKKHLTIALYPGCVYGVAEPVLLQSFHNPFIFRCVNGDLIDGKDTGLSRYLYRSCRYRDQVGPFFTCDASWLTEYPVNPLAIGQYVNNESTYYPANVAYQEFMVPLGFPFHLRKYLPNNYFSALLEDNLNDRLLHTVVLVSLRDIHQGEELFSSYFTLIE